MKPNWFWKIYIAIFTIISLNNIIFSLSSKSLNYQYYHILSAFDSASAVFYYLNVASALLTVSSIFPLISYITPKKIKYIQFWQWLFFLRIFTDLTGHSYEILLCRSTFHMDHRAGWALCGILALPILPSYIIHWKSAFK